jgi:hypothetical protein
MVPGGAAAVLRFGFAAYCQGYERLTGQGAIDRRSLASTYRIARTTTTEIVDLPPPGIDELTDLTYRYWAKSVPLILDRTAERSMVHAYASVSSQLIVLQEVPTDPRELFLNYIHESAHDRLQRCSIGWFLGVLAGVRTELATQYNVTIDTELSRRFRELAPENNPHVNRHFGLNRSIENTDAAINYVTKVWGPLRWHVATRLDAHELMAIAVRIQGIIDAIVDVCEAVNEGFASWLEIRSGKTPSTAHTLTVSYLLRFFFPHGQMGDGTGPAEDGTVTTKGTAAARAARRESFTGGRGRRSWVEAFDLFDQVFHAADSVEEGEVWVQWAAYLALSLPFTNMIDRDLLDCPASEVPERVRYIIGCPIHRLRALASDAPSTFKQLSPNTLRSILRSLDLAGDASVLATPEVAAADAAYSIIFNSGRLRQLTDGYGYDPSNRAFRSTTREDLFWLGHQDAVVDELPVVLAPPNTLIAINPLDALHSIPDMCAGYEVSLLMQRYS